MKSYFLILRDIVESTVFNESFGQSGHLLRLSYKLTCVYINITRSPPGCKANSIPLDCGLQQSSILSVLNLISLAMLSVRVKNRGVSQRFLAQKIMLSSWAHSGPM